MTAGKHRCPVGGCVLEIADRFLMCGDHWSMVPRPLQQDVYRAYARGAGLGTEALLEAQLAAVRSVNARLRPAS